MRIRFLLNMSAISRSDFLRHCDFHPKAGSALQNKKGVGVLGSLKNVVKGTIIVLTLTYSSPCAISRERSQNQHSRAVLHAGDVFNVKSQRGYEESGENSRSKQSEASNRPQARIPALLEVVSNIHR